MGKRCLAKLIRGSIPDGGQQEKKHKAGHLGRHPAARPAPCSSNGPQPVQEDGGLEAGGSGDAYSALMGMLSAGQGEVSEALRRRRREADGQDSESESGGGSEEDGASSQEGSGRDSESESEIALKAGKKGRRGKGPGLRKGEGSGSKKVATGTEVKESRGEGSMRGSELGSEMEEEQGGDRHGVHIEKQAQGGGQAAAINGLDPQGNASGEGAAVTAEQGGPGQIVLLPPPSDTWDQHMERVLTDAQVQELQGQSSRPKYVDVHHPDHQGVLPPHCHWQAAQREGLPPAPHTLDAFHIKDRLQVRWREVHGQDGKEQTEAGASKAAAEANGSGGDEGLQQGDGSHGSGDRGQKLRGLRPKEQQQEQRERNEEEQRIAQGLGEAGRGSGGAFVSDCQRSVFAAMHSYADVTMPCRAYPTSMRDPDPTMDAYLLHCLNHVSKTADRIKRNNTRLEAASKQQQAEGQAGTASVEDLPRDQGFTRPKVLILVPQRNLAYKLVVRLVALAMKETRADSVQGKERFVEQFTDPEAEEENMDEGTRTRRMAKPADWRALFTGNTDDHFRLGIKITRGAIRLFADLFQSDIIVASPLALATKLAEDKRRAAGKGDRGKHASAAAAKAAKAAGSGGEAGASSDFLSSIEVLVMDRADVMAMQNWAHVETVVEALNQLPRQQHGVDIMRVREWQLSGWAKHYRQNILLSSFLTPEMNALAGGAMCANHAGRLKVRQEEQGLLSRVVPQVQQVFERFKASSPATMADARFEHFTHVVWPRLKDACGSGGMLLFVPSYFDFVRLRNFLNAEDHDLFDTISEYTAPPDVTAARSRFYHRRVKMLMYTERAHFYHRHRVRGIRDIVFYAPPEHGPFYPDLLNLMEDTGRALTGPGGQPQESQSSLAHHSTVGLLFCRWDVMGLERLVGTARTKKMISGESSTFMFC